MPPKKSIGGKQSQLNESVSVMEEANYVILNNEIMCVCMCNEQLQ